MIGKTLQELLPESSVKKLAPIYSKALEGITTENYISDYRECVFSATTMPLKTFNGEIIGGMVVSTDITEHQKMEVQLREREYFFKESQKAASIGSYKVNYLTGYWESSEVLDSIFGITEDFDRSIKSWLKIIHQDDRQTIADYLQTEILANKKSFDKEYRIIDQSDKKTKWIHDVGKISTDNNGIVTSLIGTIQDITLQKEITEELAASEAKFRMIAENSIDIIWTMNQSGKFTYISPSVVNMIGYSAEKAFGKSTEEVFTSRSLDLIKTSIAATLARFRAGDTSVNPRLYELEVICRDGSVIWTESLVRGIFDGDNKFQAFMGITRDITAMKKVDLALKENEQRFQQVSDASGIWVWEVDEKGRYTYVSDSVEHLLGYKPEELIGKKHFYDCFTPESKATLKKAALEVFARKESFKDFENPNLHKDGHVVILETSGTPLIDENGRLIGYRGADKDISGRKLAEETTKESELKFRSFFENSPTGISMTSLDGALHANKAFCEMLGYTEEELIGKKIFNITHPDDIEHGEAILDSLTNENGQKFRFEKRYIHKTGKIIWADVSAYLYKDSNGKPLYFIASFLDITERKEIEEALTKKMYDLERFHKHTIDRELTMINLKKEVNDLLIQLGKEEKYIIRQ